MEKLSPEGTVLRGVGEPWSTLPTGKSYLVPDVQARVLVHQALQYQA